MAKVKIDVVLSRDEIHNKIPYALICETRYGCLWETIRRRRRWLAEFSEAERNAASRLFKLAHSWYLVKGVPDEVRMSCHTFKLWLKLADFCGSL